MMPPEADKQHWIVLWIIIYVSIYIAKIKAIYRKWHFKQWDLPQNKVIFSTSLILIMISILRNSDKGDVLP